MVPNDHRLTFDTIDEIEDLKLMHMYELHRYIMFLEVKGGNATGNRCGVNNLHINIAQIRQTFNRALYMHTELLASV